MCSFGSRAAICGKSEDQECPHRGRCPHLPWSSEARQFCDDPGGRSMTVAEQTPTDGPPGSPSGPPRNGRWSGFSHLLRARLLELKREPEVIFWVFGFPLLLALGLGIAFRNKPADITSVAYVRGPGMSYFLETVRRFPQGSSIMVTTLDREPALEGFR